MNSKILIGIIIVLVIGGGIFWYVTTNNSQQQNTMNQTQVTPTTTSMGKNQIQIQNFKFSPDTLTVKVGDGVTWTNNDSIDHSATADDNSFDTGLIATGKSGNITFNKAGTYTYHCSIHPTMKGTIIVQ